MLKKIFAAFSICALTFAAQSCIKGEDEPEISTGIEDDGSGKIPTKSEIIGTWESNEYQGWEPKLQQDVVIYRQLKLHADGTYENRYGGHLTQSKDGSSLSTTEFGEWEQETGTWTYNESVGTITYVPLTDERIVYDTQQMQNYIDNITTYQENCIIKESGTYKGMWITLDTYLKRAGNKGDLRYALSKK